MKEEKNLKRKKSKTVISWSNLVCEVMKVKV
jgi:hypothetical protein